MADDQDKASRVAATSELGKRLADIGGIKRIGFYARTYETSRDQIPAPALIDDEGPVGQLARMDYYEMLSRTQMKKPLRRDLLITITLSVRKSASDIAANGGEIEGISRVLSNRVAQVVELIEHCGARFEDAKWLGAAEIRGAVRLAFDPAASSWLENNHWFHPFDKPLVTYLREKLDHLITNSAHHRTYWMESWPTTITDAGFLHPLIADGDIPRTVCEIWEPESVRVAEKNINNTLVSQETISNLNGLIGKRTSVSTKAESADLELQQHEMQLGFGNIRYSAWVTVHARSQKQLDEADMWVHSASYGIRMNALRGRHLASFATAALPLGLRDPNQ
jgi:hypothetical protein